MSNPDRSVSASMRISFALLVFLGRLDAVTLTAEEGLVKIFRWPYLFPFWRVFGLLILRRILFGTDFKDSFTSKQTYFGFHHFSMPPKRLLLRQFLIFPSKIEVRCQSTMSGRYGCDVAFRGSYRREKPFVNNDVVKLLGHSLWMPTRFRKYIRPFSSFTTAFMYRLSSKRA